jgi:hypothetical protein
VEGRRLALECAQAAVDVSVWDLCGLIIERGERVSGKVLKGTRLGRFQPRHLCLELEAQLGAFILGHPLPCHRFDARTRGKSPVR